MRVGVFAALFSPLAAHAAAKTLVPIGGDYDTFTDFSRIVIGNATGPMVDMLILPPAYGETKDVAKSNGDYHLAKQHVADLLAACSAIVNLQTFPGGCVVTLVDWFTLDDGNSPAVVSAVSAPSLDGVYFLGGVQDGAMEVIAGTQGEAALATSYARGVVAGGTSAGDALLSRNMTDGFFDAFDTSTALQFGAMDMWFGPPSAPLMRGISFGSTKALFDEHMYERGRFGRLINETARTTDQFGHGGLISIGVDTDTAPVVRNDQTISEVFGTSSLSIIDFKTLSTHYAWVDTTGHAIANPDPTANATAALSVRNALVHVLAPHAASGSITYDFGTRVAAFNGANKPFPAGGNHIGCEGITAAKPILLGGDLSVGPTWPTDSKVLEALISRAKGSGPILLIAAGYSKKKDQTADITNYTSALSMSGWAGTVTSVIYPKKSPSNADLSGAAAVIILADNQADLPTLLADTAFVSLVRSAQSLSPIVLLDRSISAMAGDVYDAVDDAADPIEAWLASQAQVQPALSLVHATRQVAFEPRVQYDYRWGRLYGIPFSAGNRRPMVFAISEATALLVTPNGASVIGENPVFVSDTQPSIFYTGDNGAFGVINSVLDVYEPGQHAGLRGNSAHALSLPHPVRDRSDTPAAHQN